MKIIKYMLAVSLMTISLALIAYIAFGNAPRAEAQRAKAASGPWRLPDERDPEFIKRRHEFLQRLFARGPDGVSPRDYAAALAAARALPPSPLLQGPGFMPQTGWTFPIPPPITNSYGADATAQIHSIAIDPTNTSVVYTGSFGGLAKTTDGGSTWQYLSDAWTSQSITAIAIDYNSHSPGSNKYIYVGTGRDDYGPYGVGIYRSFDGGTTWSGPLGAAQFAGVEINAITTIGSGSQSSATVYVASNTGLWRSTDSGSTWAFVYQRNNYPNGIWDVAKDPWTSALYITDYDGMLKSVDSGQTWTTVFPNPSWQNKLGLVTPPRSFSSWVYFIDPDHPNSNFFKSTDGGSNWTQIQTVCPVGDDDCNGTNIGLARFAVDPANTQVIVAGNWGEGGGTTSLFRTSNEGGSWTDVGHWTGPVHADHHALAFSAGGQVVYDGNDGGIIKSTDTGSTWTNLNHNFPGALLYSVALSRDGSMIAGTQDNGVVYSNLGAAWNAIAGGDSSHDLIDPLGSTWAYEQIYYPYWGYFNRYNRLTGATYNIAPQQLQSDNACAFFPTFSMNLSSPTHLVAACQHVVRTLDGTASPVVWTTIGQDPVCGTGLHCTVTAAAEAPSNSNIIYAITSGGNNAPYGFNVKLTTDANDGSAATWSDVTSNIPAGTQLRAIAIDPSNPQTAYIAATQGIYKTTNMGASWTQTLAIPNLVYQDVAISPTRPQNIYAAANAGVFASGDGGTSWGSDSVGIPQGMAVTSLSYNKSSVKLAAGTYGRGACTILAP
jgi:photosystem II stability/assembly factor-like uncharacterized protein/cbb3-type cytochrome oxidase subunit 3